MLKVTYIIGTGRSGSTLLGNVLGALSGVFHAGELLRLWKFGVTRNTPCGCGQTVLACPVWAEVLTREFPMVLESGTEIARLASLQRSMTRTRRTVELLRGSVGEDAREYASVMQRIYQGIAATTGATIIIDSSKRPAPAALLRHIAGVEHGYVHLVRDPRAEAFSWTRHKAVPGEPGGHLPRMRAPAAAMTWLCFHAVAEMVVRGQPSITVRYEDLATRPAETLTAIRRGVDGRTDASPILGDSVALGVNHAIGGNPVKFRQGHVEIRRDDEWMTQQSRFDRSVVTVMTVPLLGRYGYPLFERTAGSA